jgi:hypothetical protein
MSVKRTKRKPATCPFCGERPYPAHDISGGAAIGCPCGVDVIFTVTRRAAVRLYRRRAADDRIATLESDRAALIKAIQHMRENSGSESCADYVLRNRELTAEVETLESQLAAWMRA